LFNSESQVKDATVAPANPEDIPVLEALQVAANEARAEYDANCTGGFCQLPWRRGTGIHSIFAAKVRAMGPLFSAEESYRDHVYVRYGLKGSVRADATYGDVTAPKFVVELKTGIFNYMSNGEATSYLNNLPYGTDVYPMYTDKFLGYFPRGQ
jgi:hypothetical protein